MSFVVMVGSGQVGWMDRRSLYGSMKIVDQ